MILYRITVTNSGSATATGITVNDTIPANTTYFATGTQGIANVGGVTGVATPGVTSGPANAATGSFIFSIGTLTPTQSAVITFGVKINQ